MQNRMTRWLGALAVALAGSLAVSSAQAFETIYGVTSDAKLVVFEAQDPETIVSTTNITGLQASETIYGIDFRPQTGELFVVGSTSRLYTINPATGAATQRGTNTFSTNPDANLAGVDFNPLTGTLRFVSNSEDNVSLGPDGSTPAVGSDITPDGDIVSIAHSNSYPGASNTVMYGLDAGSNSLVTFSGTTASTVGSGLGFDIEDNSAMDYHGEILWAVLRINGVSRLHIIDPSAGTASAALGLVGNGTLEFTGITVAADPLLTVSKKGSGPPKVSIKLNFAKPDADGISVAGTVHVPEGFSVAGKTVTIDVGGASRTFTLDAKGKAKVGTDSFSIKVKAKKVDGVPTVLAQDAKYKFSAKKGNFAGDLEDEGLINDLVVGATVHVPVSLYMNGHLHQIMTHLFYKAKLDKKGAAK